MKSWEFVGVIRVPKERAGPVSVVVIRPDESNKSA